jgi:hypothetical protein
LAEAFFQPVALGRLVNNDASVLPTAARTLRIKRPESPTARADPHTLINNPIEVPVLPNSHSTKMPGL